MASDPPHEADLIGAAGASLPATVRPRRIDDIARDLSQELGLLRNPIAARRDAGQMPAIGRRAILQSPIWHVPKVAKAEMQEAFTWRTVDGWRRITVINNAADVDRAAVSRTGTRYRKRVYAPSGLLQWVDLDVVMTLTYITIENYMRGGAPEATIGQMQLLRHLGYGNLTDPPYEALRASWERLRVTDIYIDEEDPETGAYNLNKRVKIGGILDDVKMASGKSCEWYARLNPNWLSNVRNENQIIDWRAYFHLMKAIRGDRPPPDVTRSVLLFLDTWRKEGQSKVRIGWLADRFADRRQVIVRPPPLPEPGTSAYENALMDLRSGARNPWWPEQPATQFKYSNPLDERGRLHAALKSLYALGILTRIEEDPDHLWLTVAWAKPSTLHQVPEVPRRGIEHTPEGFAQRVLFDRAMDGSPLSLGHQEAGASGADGREEQPQAARGGAGGAVRGRAAPGADTAPGTAGAGTGEAVAPAFGGRSRWEGDEDDGADGAADAVEADGDGQDAEEGPAPVPAPAPAAPAAGEGATAQQLAYVLRILSVGRARIETAARAGWDEARLLRLCIEALYGREQGEIAKPAGYVVTSLADRQPEDYDAAVFTRRHQGDGLAAWWKGPSSPLAGSGLQPAPARPAALRVAERTPAPVDEAPRANEQAVETLFAELQENPDLARSVLGLDETVLASSPRLTMAALGLLGDIPRMARWKEAVRQARRGR